MYNEGRIVRRFAAGFQFIRKGEKLWDLFKQEYPL